MADGDRTERGGAAPIAAARPQARPARAEAELVLRKDLARHLRAGHPWVFRKAVERAPKGLPAGAIVDVTDGGRFVARGYYDPHSAISVRILTREAAEPVDATFWRRRVARAVALRRELVHGTTGYRLVHGESDGLPGVVADRYDRFAVVKLYSAGLTPHRGAIVEAIRAEAGDLQGVFGRDEIPRDDLDGDEGGAPASSPAPSRSSRGISSRPYTPWSPSASARTASTISPRCGVSPAE